MGKWHARLVAVLGTFLVMGFLATAGGFLLLHSDLSLGGVALVTTAALLAVVVTCGVTVSAMTNSTVLGIAVLWMIVYGAGFALYLLPADFPSPERALNNLPHILRGYYSLHTLGRLVGWSALASGVAAAIGLFYFSRRDV